MCRGDRLVADFVAGTGTRPDLPEELDEHLTATMDGLWVVWAYKVARRAGDLFVPLTGGSGYPRDATAECRRPRGRGLHRAPDPGCTCGFHALSSRRLPGLPGRPGLTTLTVALSGRVLALEWAGEGVLWRAERQTVVRVEQAVRRDWGEAAGGSRRDPGDPDDRAVAFSAAPPRGSGPVRLSLPVTCPVVLVPRDDAGWCVASSTVREPPKSLVLA